MELVQALTLALVQGLTEFLPISSSAHLVITSKLLGWADQGLAFDLGLHLGTLAAVMGYFWRDLAGYLGVLRYWRKHPYWRELLLLAFASLPAAVLGLLLAEWVETNLRSLVIIVIANTFFALLLWLADSRSRASEQSQRLLARDMPWIYALGIGCAQALAFIPGASRSGVTLSAALFLGLSRQEAARFSFLLSIPIILGGGLLTLGDLVGTGARPEMLLLLLAIGTAFVIALACIGLFMRMIANMSLSLFVLYRLILSGFLLVWLI